MENIVWILILVYIFVVGFFAAVKLSSFVSHNPKAFPGNHKSVIVSPPIWKNHNEDDGTCNLCYNDLTNFEEFENHEACDP